jgi:hypothetical protein
MAPLLIPCNVLLKIPDELRQPPKTIRFFASRKMPMISFSLRVIETYDPLPVHDVYERVFIPVRGVLRDPNPPNLHLYRIAQLVRNLFVQNELAIHVGIIDQQRTHVNPNYTRR